jgi:Leucine-rich repeat (LRR) protein
MPRLFTLLFCYVLILCDFSCLARNLRASALFGTVLTPVLEFKLLSPAAGIDGYQTFPFHPTFGSPSLPLSDREDQTLDFDLMLPNVADDPYACSGPLSKTDELGRNFSNAFILILGTCATGIPNALASGAAGAIFYACHGPSCNPADQQRLGYGSTRPTLGINNTNGVHLFNYLTAVRNGTLPQVPLTIQFVSTSTIVEDELAALISIAQETTMAPFGGGGIPAPRANWNATMFNVSDPCRNRPIGLWCERGHVVLIDVPAHGWFSSFVPVDFSVFSELRMLSLTTNSFSGSIPKEWCALSNLRVLRLENQIPPSAITGLPECIGAWTNLTEFQFTQQAITYLPTEFSMLTSLRYVMGAGNGFSSLPSITGMSQLVTFDVSGNRISGSFPDFNHAAPLTGFYIGGNALSGSVPTNAFDGIATLIDLDVNSNQLEGPLPSLDNCSSLRQADFGSQSGGGFTGARPATWEKLSQLFYLDLQGNSISQFTAADLPSLDTLDLSFNQIATTSVSTLLVSLLGSNLRSLSLSHNYLSGPFTIPTSMYGLVTFKSLFLDNNMLTSVDPNLFLLDLATLDLSHNNLTTTVTPFPATTTPKTTFSRLDLRGNPAYRLSGGLPAWLGVASPSEGRVQVDGDPFLCLSIIVLNPVSMTILVDPSFWNYQNCICASGTFGTAPSCLEIPVSASLHPDRYVSADFSESDFLSSLSTERIVPNNNTRVSRWISDEMYGSARLTPGMNSKWVTNLSDVHDEDGASPRVITWFIYINTDFFSQISDTLSVYEGGPDLQGARVMITNGASLIGTNTTSLNISRDYILSEDGDVSFPIDRAVLLTVDVLSAITTVHFESEKTAGLHFAARYEYSFDCPTGFYLDTQKGACRVQLPRFYVDEGVRGAVFAVASVAGCLQILLLVVLLVDSTNPVYRAGSLPHLFLTLIFLLAMSLGAMLYAAVPEEQQSTNAAVVTHSYGKPTIAARDPKQ